MSRAVNAFAFALLALGLYLAMVYVGRGGSDPAEFVSYPLGGAVVGLFGRAPPQSLWRALAWSIAGAVVAVGGSVAFACVHDGFSSIDCSLGVPILVTGTPLVAAAFCLFSVARFLLLRRRTTAAPPTA